MKMNIDASEFARRTLVKGFVDDWNKFREDNQLKIITLQNIVISGKDLEELNLHKTIISESKLSGCRFTGSLLTNVLFNRCDFFESDFSNSIVRYSEFKNSVLIGTNFKDVDLSNVSFLRTDITGTCLTGSNLDDTMFNNCILNDITLDYFYTDNNMTCRHPASGNFPNNYGQYLLSKMNKPNNLYKTPHFLGVNLCPSVFISHSHQDKRFVRALANKLGLAGIRVWIDEAEIKYGESLITKLTEAIDNVNYVLAVISSNSINSSWVQKELQIAMNEEITNRKVVVIPIMKEVVRVPIFIKDKLYGDFTSIYKRKKSVNLLIDSIYSLTMCN